MNAEPLIRLEGLTVGFPTPDGGWRHVVDGVTLAIDAGERVGLVGESGSGKSVTALACLGLVPEPGRVTGGSVSVAGIDIAMMSAGGLNRLRGREIGIILQEAAEALNPVYTVGFQVTEAVAVHRDLRHREAHREALSLLSVAALEAPEKIGAGHRASRPSGRRRRHGPPPHQSRSRRC